MYELKVENMTCGHCVSRVTETVKSVDPAAIVVIDLESKNLRIDSKHELAGLTAALDEAGYPATPISASV